MSADEEYPVVTRKSLDMAKYILKNEMLNKIVTKATIIGKTTV